MPAGFNLLIARRICNHDGIVSAQDLGDWSFLLMLKLAGCYDRGLGIRWNQVGSEGHNVVVVDMTSACHGHGCLLLAQTPCTSGSSQATEEKGNYPRRDETRKYLESSSPDRDNVCRMEHTASRGHGNRQGSGSLPTQPAAIIPPNSVRTPTAYQQRSHSRAER
jgi:hypothetical protein